MPLLQHFIFQNHFISIKISSKEMNDFFLLLSLLLGQKQILYCKKKIQSIQINFLQRYRQLSPLQRTP